MKSRLSVAFGAEIQGWFYGFFWEPLVLLDDGNLHAWALEHKLFEVGHSDLSPCFALIQAFWLLKPFWSFHAAVATINSQ